MRSSPGGGRTLRAALIACSIACGCTAVDTAQQPAPAPAQTAVPQAGEDEAEVPVDIRAHRWSTRLEGGDACRLENRYGDLRARNSGDSGLQYAAVVQKLRDERRDPQFPVERAEGGLTLRVAVPGDWDGRVDASARVPAGSPLRLRTGAGLIDVRVGDNDVDARSDGGFIRLRGAAAMQARSEDGDIVVVLESVAYDGDAGAAASAGGDIDLWVRPDADLLIRAAAGGSIAEELPGDMRTEAAGISTLRLGSGASVFEVRAERGSVVIRALPIPPPADSG